MKKIIRLTESDLTRIVRRVISEQDEIYPKQDDQPSEKNKKFNDFLFKLNQTLVNKISESFKDIFQTDKFLFKPYYTGQDLGIQVIKGNKKEVINLVKMGDAKDSCEIMKKYLRKCEQLGGPEELLYSAIEYMDNLMFNKTVRTSLYHNTRKDNDRMANVERFQDEVRNIVEELVGEKSSYDCYRFKY